MSEQALAQSYSLKFPVYFIVPESPELEISAEMDLTTGEYLGLLFTGEQAAKRYKYLHGLTDEKVIPLTESNLVQLSRRIEKAGIIKTYVLDYVQVNPKVPVVSILVAEMARRVIPEDMDSPS